MGGVKQEGAKIYQQQHGINCFFPTSSARVMELHRIGYNKSRICVFGYKRPTERNVNGMRIFLHGDVR